MSHFNGPTIYEAYPDLQPNNSILQELMECLKENGEKTFLVEDDTSETVTYTDFLKMSSSLAAGLQRQGVGEDDIVVITMKKTIRAFATLLGAMFAGATAVVIPPVYASSLHELTKGRPVKAVFFDDLCRDPVMKSVSALSPIPCLVVDTNPADPVMTSLTAPVQNFTLNNFKDVQKRVLVVMFTSGTTGSPKGVMITNKIIQIQSRYLYESRFNTVLVVSRMHWQTIALIGVISSILKANTFVLTNVVDPTVNLELVQKYKVNILILATGLMNPYFEEAESHKYDLSSINEVVTGGEPVFNHVIVDLYSKAFGDKVNLNLVYACSEIGCIAHWSKMKDPRSFKTFLCGKPIPGVEIKILDDDGVVVPVGCEGEVWLKAEQMSPGYFCKPDLNDQILNRDGFFRIGDVGYFDGDGYLYVQGRVCDLITSGTKKVLPSKLEEVMTTHPEILDTAIVNVPGSTSSTQLIAYVIRKKGSLVTEKEIAAYFNERVDETYKLQRVAFLKSFPRNNSYKINRKKLQDMACQHLKSNDTY